jgi:hypothetical protein
MFFQVIDRFGFAVTPETRSKRSIRCKYRRVQISIWGVPTIFLGLFLLNLCPLLTRHIRILINYNIQINIT